MNKIHNIVGRITKVKYTKNDMDLVLDFLENMQDNKVEQNVFFEYCKKFKIAPWVYLRLSSEQLLHYLDNEFKLIFEQEYLKVLLQNEDRNEQAAIVLKEFVANGIEVIVLKGNVFTQTIYNSFGYKRMNDFDILIKKQDWSKVQDIYKNLDFIPLGFGWTGEKHKATNFSHTGIPYMSRNLKCMVGSQWGLKAPTSSYKFDIDEIWETAEDFDFKGIKVKKLSPKNNLLHLVLHLGVYKCGVRDCMDIYNLLLTENIETQDLNQFFSKANGLDKAFFALDLCNKMANVPDYAVVKSLDNGKKSLIKTILEKRHKAMNEAENWHVSYNNYFQDIEKNVVYSNVFHSFHIKFVFFFKIIRQMFFPKSKVALLFIEKSHQPTMFNKIKAFFMAPYYILSLLAEEIGLKATFFILAKLFVNLIFSVKNYIKPKPNYFDFLEQQGINPQSVKKMVSNVQ